MKWTEEEYAALRLYASEKMATKVAYEEFSETGYERSLGAFTKKYRLVLREHNQTATLSEATVDINGELSISEVEVPYDRKADGPDFIVVAAVVIAVLIIGYMWTQ